ncbi:MAG: hypothetical protein AAB307_06985 [Deltaproteobacteria bacterium]
MLRVGADEEAKNAHMYSDDQLAEHIMEKAGDWSIPLQRQDIGVERGETGIKITASYHVIVNLELLGNYKHRLNYRIEVSKPIKGPPQPLR